MPEPRLYQRGRVWWTWFIDAQGTRHQLSTKCRDKRAARERALQLERDVAAAGGVAPRAQHTIHEALAAAIEQQQHAGRSPATVRAATYHARHLLEHIDPATPLIAVTAATTSDYARARLGQGASKHTVRKEVGFLVQSARRASKLGRYVPVLAPDALMPDELEGHYTPRDRWLTTEELTALLAGLPEDRRDYVLAIVHLGLRSGELFAVTAGDFDDGVLRVRGTKTAKARRSVPASERIAPILEARKSAARGADELLFPAWTNARRDLRAACKRAGIDPCGLHDLRRTHAQQLLNAGVPERVIADLLGHTTTTLVRSTYASKVALDQLRDAVNRL